MCHFRRNSVKPDLVPFKFYYATITDRERVLHGAPLAEDVPLERGRELLPERGLRVRRRSVGGCRGLPLERRHRLLQDALLKKSL